MSSNVIAAIDSEGGLRSFIGTDDETTDEYEDGIAAQLYFDKIAVFFCFCLGFE